jgi:hypothetical protein
MDVGWSTAAEQAASEAALEDGWRRVHTAQGISFAIFHPCGVFNLMQVPRQPQLQ